MQPNKRTDAATERAVLAALGRGASKRGVAQEHGIGEATVRRILERAKSTVTPQVIFEDKKTGKLDWREAIGVFKQMQDFSKKASWSQQFATVEIGNGVDPVGIVELCDTHIGAKGTDYDLLLMITDMVLSVPNLYIVLNGDLGEYGIKLRGVAEVCAQIIAPDLQTEFIESWFDTIKHRVIAAGYGNHDVERSQTLSGESHLKSILNRSTVYFDGIGHLDIKTGAQTYRTVMSHVFRGASQNDVTAGCRRYMRFESHDREIAFQGDRHRPKIEKYTDGDIERCAVSAGTLHLKSGFANRYFSLFTNPAFPVVALYPQRHQFTPFFSIQEYMDAFGYKVSGDDATA